MLKDDVDSQIECRDSPELNLRGHIQHMKEHVLNGKEEYEEELEHYLEIETLCFGSDRHHDDIEANR